MHREKEWFLNKPDTFAKNLILGNTQTFTGTEVSYQLLQGQAESAKRGFTVTCGL
jgi:hypothetical protein